MAKKKGDAEVPLILYVFFSKRNCLDCMEGMEILNKLPPHFIVRGIVPKKELEDEKEYLENFLESLYNKLWPIFLEQKTTK